MMPAPPGVRACHSEHVIRVVASAPVRAGAGACSRIASARRAADSFCAPAAALRISFPASVLAQNLRWLPSCAVSRRAGIIFCPQLHTITAVSAWKNARTALGMRFFALQNGMCVATIGLARRWFPRAPETFPPTVASRRKRPSHDTCLKRPPPGFPLPAAVCFSGSRPRLDRHRRWDLSLGRDPMLDLLRR